MLLAHIIDPRSSHSLQNQNPPPGTLGSRVLLLRYGAHLREMEDVCYKFQFTESFYFLVGVMIFSICLNSYVSPRLLTQPYIPMLGRSVDGRGNLCQE